MNPPPATDVPGPDAPPPTLKWAGGTDGVLELLDQTRLPGVEVVLPCRTAADVFAAIRRLSVRGAPAIGVAAAYGLVLGVRDAAGSDGDAFTRRLHAVRDELAGSRPTAVNLFWALDRMTAADADHAAQPPPVRLERLLAEARRIEAEDRAMCTAIGRHGAALLPAGTADEPVGVLTHCNAGGLATAGDGTALSVLFAAAAAGKHPHVFADETRPLLQGSRLTAWELSRRGVPVTVLCDSAAGHLLAGGRIAAVVTGADRVAANGDAANKIGTYPLAVLAHRHGVPFYVAAPTSTFDPSLATGAGIPIEQRDAEEVLSPAGVRCAPPGVAAFNPAFDVTPADLIAGLVTERGVIAPVTAANVAALLGGGVA